MRVEGVLVVCVVCVCNSPAGLCACVSRRACNTDGRNKLGCFIGRCGRAEVVRVFFFFFSFTVATTRHDFCSAVGVDAQDFHETRP